MVSPRTWAREWRVLLEFVAGFCATLLFHQPALWLLHIAGMTARTPYVMTAVPPFNVPAVISLAFWGGIWGLILIPAIARVRNETGYWIAAIVFGAVAPTLVAWFIVASIKHQPIAAGWKPSAMALGLIVNGAWGLGTALLFRVFVRTR
jgi:hypothetical protein